MNLPKWPVAAPMNVKPGDIVVDPMQRHVTVVRTGEDWTGPFIEVRLGGSYGATARYTESMLRFPFPKETAR